MKNREIRIKHPTDENARKIILKIRGPGLISARDVMKKFKKGVTNWINETEEGKAALKKYFGNLNIINIQEYLQNEELYICLREQELEVHLITTDISDYVDEFWNTESNLFEKK